MIGFCESQLFFFDEKKVHPFFQITKAFNAFQFPHRFLIKPPERLREMVNNGEKLKNIRSINKQIYAHAIDTGVVLSRDGAVASNQYDFASFSFTSLFLFYPGSR